MAEEIEKELGLKAELIPGKPNSFDVIVDGKLIFSKFETGRFPYQGEIVKKIKVLY